MLTAIPAELLRLFGGGLLLGLALALIYDVLRITRVLMGTSYGSRTAGRLAALPMPPIRQRTGNPGRRIRDLVVNLEDLFFFPVCGAAVAVYLSAVYDGRVRWPAFFGIGLGVLLWRLTIGKVLIACSAAIAELLRFAFVWLFWGISRPLIWAWRWSVGCLRALLRWLWLPIYSRWAMRRFLRRMAHALTKFEMEG